MDEQAEQIEEQTMQLQHLESLGKKSKEQAGQLVEIQLSRDSLEREHEKDKIQMNRQVQELEGARQQVEDQQALLEQLAKDSKQQIRA